MANGEALKILDSCNLTGIKSIFVSRKSDSIALRQAIDEAAASSNKLWLLGIAFRSLFDTSAPYTNPMRDLLDNPKVNLRVLLLNPESMAANHRATLELGNATIEDIRHTMNQGLVATFQRRLRKIIDEWKIGWKIGDRQIILH